MKKLIAFKKKYAQYYDLFYSGSKDYKTETDYLEKLFEKYGGKNIKHVLDVACGTGNHAIELAKRGYQVEAADISYAMLEQAKKKAKKMDLNIKFFKAPMQELPSGKLYDAVICMFASIDYLVKKEDIKKALAKMRSVLRKGGLLILDFWNMERFQLNEQRYRIKDIRKDGVRLIRISDNTNDKKRKLMDVTITCLVIKENRIVDEFKENHLSRYFSCREMRELMKESGFQVLNISPFMKYGGSIKGAWFLSLIAKKIKRCLR